jgi:regulator of replication initiation timing
MIKINKLWPPYIEDADLQPEQGLFNAQLSIEIEVGVGPQDRMAQSQFLAQHQQWLTGFAIPQGLAGPEHSIKCQAKIGKLQGVPFDDLMRSPEDMDSIQQMQQQMQQMGQQLEQVGQQTQEMQQFIQKLQGEKQQLELKASSQSPELEQMKLQADMTVERAKIEADMIIEREKMAMDAQLAREKMAIDAQVAAMRPAPQPKQQQVL